MYKQAEFADKEVFTNLAAFVAAGRRSGSTTFSALLGPTGEDEVVLLCEKSVLPREVCAQRLSASDAPMSFWDPKLRSSRKDYLQLWQRLVNCGVLCYGLTQLCFVEILAVAQNYGIQRLVVNARRPKLCFDDPPGVSSPRLLPLRDQSCSHTSRCFEHTSTLAMLFVILRIPSSIRPFFVQVLSLTTRIFFQFRALAMGWTQAVALCQRVFSRISQTLCTCASAVRHLSVYVDNPAVLGKSEPGIRNAARTLPQSTHAAGLKTHEREENCQDV